MAERVQARGPGRVNLIGEHTDYNDGLALPFAIARGVTVTAEPAAGDRVTADALDLGERDEFPLSAPDRADGWRGFVRGAVGELRAAGYALRPCRLEITGDLDQGQGLSSSAAMETALCLALLGVAGEDEPADRRDLARLCSRIENDWVGAETGLLDQLASLYGGPVRIDFASLELDPVPLDLGDWSLVTVDSGATHSIAASGYNDWVGAETGLLDQLASLYGGPVRIDFASLELDPVPLELGDWSLVTVDSGATHSIAASGYNDRRRECREACERLGIGSLREARPEDLDRLDGPHAARARHVLTENARVEATIAALKAGDLEEVGRLLDASHASLRDDYESSVPEVERTVAALKAAGAAGARMMGGGFGGAVLALLGPGVVGPGGALVVHPGPPAALV